MCTADRRRIAGEFRKDVEDKSLEANLKTMMSKVRGSDEFWSSRYRTLQVLDRFWG